MVFSQNLLQDSAWTDRSKKETGQTEQIFFIHKITTANRCAACVKMYIAVEQIEKSYIMDALDKDCFTVHRLTTIP